MSHVIASLGLGTYLQCAGHLPFEERQVFVVQYEFTSSKVFLLVCFQLHFLGKLVCQQ